MRSSRGVFARHALAAGAFLVASLGLAAVAALAAARPAGSPPLRAILLSPAPGEVGAQQIEIFNGDEGHWNFVRLPGAMGGEFISLTAPDLANVDSLLRVAGERGPGACDTLPRFIGRPQVWEIREFGRGDSLTSPPLDTWRASLESIRCRTHVAQARDSTARLTARGLAYFRLADLGGPAYAMGAPKERPSWELPMQRIFMRDSLIQDARRERSTRDWSRVALDLSTEWGRHGRGVRLSTAPLPVAPGDLFPRRRVAIDAPALKAAILSFLPRGPIEVASYRAPTRAMRGGTVARFAITQWDAARRTATPIFDAYLTPLEMDSLARGVVAVIAPRAPRAADEVRVALALPDAPLRVPPPLQLAAATDETLPEALCFTPASGRDFVSPFLFARQSIDASYPWRKLDRAGPMVIDQGMQIGLATLPVSDAGLRTALEVVRRAERDDSTGCDPMPQYPQWPRTWRVEFAWRVPPDSVIVTHALVVPTRRVRCRALEWLESLEPTGHDEERGILRSLSTLGVPDPDEAVHKSHNVSIAEPRDPEDVRRELLSRRPAARGATVARNLEFSLWLFWPHSYGGSSGIRLTEVPDAPPSNDWMSGVPVVSHAELRAVLAGVLDEPGVRSGSERTRRDIPRGEGFGKLCIVSRESGRPHPLYIAYLTADEARRVAGRVAAALDARHADLAAAARRQAQHF